MVLKGEATNIIGYSAATALGLVIIQCDNDPTPIIQSKSFVRTITKNTNVFTSPLISHPMLFTGKIGKLIGYQAHLDVDKSIRPCQQRAYPVPFNLQKGYEEKLDFLENQGIISKATSEIPTWIHPAHPVGKFDDQNNLIGVRITGNCKQLNKAIVQRKRHMPTIPEMTSKMAGSKWFSLIDFNDALAK